MNRLEYWRDQKYIIISDPTMDDISDAISKLGTEERNSVRITLGQKGMAVYLDEFRERIHVRYIPASQPKKLIFGCYFLVEKENATDQPTDDPLDIPYKEDNGEGFHASIYSTLPKEIALEPIMALLEDRDLPEWATLTEYL